jgi:imidazolonepropionase
LAEWDRVWVGARIAAMVAGGQPYGKLAADALAVKGERIAWIGSASEAMRRAAEGSIPVEGCEGLWIMPGLIDCHTHLVYGGNRVEEFEKRLCGVSYEDIARAGGGIQSTVRATRAADTMTLAAAAAVRAQRLMSEGVTTIEVKSGYGLDLATERRMLEAARALEDTLPVSIKTTYLGLHATIAGASSHKSAARGSSRSPPRAWWMRSMPSARTSRSRSTRPRLSWPPVRSWDCELTCTPAS